MDTNINVFIVHYKKLVERKQRLNQMLLDAGFQTKNIHWFEENDRDTLTNEQKNMYVYDYNKWYEVNGSWRHYESRPRKLRGPEIACCVTHIEIYKYIIEHNIDIAMIFEDDTILKSNFKTDFPIILRDIYTLYNKGLFDICFINDSFGWTTENFIESNFSKPDLNYMASTNKQKYTGSLCEVKSSKCSCSYIISNEAAKLMCKYIVPFYVPIDWMQNYVITTQNMNCYWSITVTDQGSDNGYTSTVDRTVPLIYPDHPEVVITNSDIEDAHNIINQMNSQLQLEFIFRIATGDDFVIVNYLNSYQLNDVDTFAFFIKSENVYINSLSRGHTGRKFIDCIYTIEDTILKRNYIVEGINATSLSVCVIAEEYILRKFEGLFNNVNLISNDSIDFLRCNVFIIQQTQYSKNVIRKLIKQYSKICIIEVV